ncbi:MAG: hypothetical protein IPF41_03380 [Flavobacteriales bacterium]|nr:hypothetical protein [Flavobacteriales bacterium]
MREQKRKSEQQEYAGDGRDPSRTINPQRVLEHGADGDLPKACGASLIQQAE